MHPEVHELGPTVKPSEKCKHDDQSIVLLRLLFSFLEQDSSVEPGWTPVYMVRVDLGDGLAACLIPADFEPKMDLRCCRCLPFSVIGNLPKRLVRTSAYPVKLGMSNFVHQRSTAHLLLDHFCRHRRFHSIPDCR